MGQNLTVQIAKLGPETDLTLTRVHTKGVVRQHAF